MSSHDSKVKTIVIVCQQLITLIYYCIKFIKKQMTDLCCLLLNKLQIHQILVVDLMCSVAVYLNTSGVRFISAVVYSVIIFQGQQIYRTVGKQIRASAIRDLHVIHVWTDFLATLYCSNFLYECVYFWTLCERWFKGLVFVLNKCVFVAFKYQ